MNVSEQITSVIDALCEKFGIAIDWTSETVIPYVEQLAQKYVAYEIWTSAATIILLVLLFVVSLVFAINMSKKAEWNDYTVCFADVATIVGAAAAIVVGIAALIVIPMECKDIITCLTFPEKQIFEYVQEIVSEMK